MRETAKSERKERKAGSSNGAKRRLQLWLVVVILFGAWAGYMFYSQSTEIHAKAAQYSQTRNQEKAAEDNLNQIKYEVNRLNDPEYIGQLARKKYGLYKPGETPIRKSTDGS